MSCIRFIDFMLKGKRLLAYKNLFPPSDYKKNVKIILKYFQQYLLKLKCIVIFATNIENKKTKTKIYNLKETSLSTVYSECGHEYQKIFKEEEPIEILKILGLIKNIDIVLQLD